MSVTQTKPRVGIPDLRSLRASAEPLHLRDDLEAHVDAYFARYGRPRHGARILVALSGGPDSVALLAALVRMSTAAGWEIGAAHVNYGLRGEESAGDHAFCRRLTRRWHVRFHTLRAQPPQRTARTNLQAWARDVRYRFFTRIATSQRYDHVALGHTLDDRAETVASAVIDASGTFALSGIPPVRGQLIRPLFDCTRREVEAYLRRHQIPFRRDSSNRSLRYRRNQIRRQVLPQWSVMNPAVVEGLARLGEHLWLQRRYLEEQADDLLQRAVRNGREDRLILDATALRDYDQCLDPFVLRAMIGRLGLDLVPRPATVTRFGELRRRTNGTAQVVEQGELTIIRSKGQIALTRTPEPRPRKWRITVPRSGSTKSDLNGIRLKTDIRDAELPQDPDDTREACLDLARIAGALTLRHPRPGDRYRPIGLGGTKKLTDLLSERAVPAFDRETVPILTDRDGILWPIGCPIAHRARVTERTRQIIRVRVVSK